MLKTSVGTRLYISVLAVFIVFAAAFIIFQHEREREYKINSLNSRLQDYNSRMIETLEYIGSYSEEALDRYVRNHHIHGLRVTLIKRDGRVVYDNMYKDYVKMDSHQNRLEVREAISNGNGFDFSRLSSTMKQTYFYSATYVPELDIVVRSALPCDNSMAEMLKADQHYLWFTLVAVLILVFILYRFVSRLGDNIAKLRLFASRADHNESLDSEDLVGFSGDELGEIAERIIKMYKRLKRTKEEQNVLKRQLTQNIAHELKTPVQAIRGCFETLLDNNLNEEMRRRLLETGYNNTMRLSNLLQDVTLITRITDEKETLEVSDVNIGDVVGEICKDVDAYSIEKKMRINVSLPENVVIRGNRQLIDAIFRNLVNNAIAYSGGRDIFISMTKETDDCYWFDVYDNGTGVEEKHLSRIFERFYRIDSGRSRKSGGTGLGLSIVRNSVLFHGGEIKASNKKSAGLEFVFSLHK